MSEVQQTFLALALVLAAMVAVLVAAMVDQGVRPLACGVATFFALSSIILAIFGSRETS